MKKILLIGLGGIGSYFIRDWFNLFENNIKGTENTDILGIDFDEVEEKNVKYQNFLISNLGKKKTIALSERYPFNFKDKRIESEDDLKGYDIILLCVDNGKVRNLVYDYCEKNNVYFIDLRSEGRSICYFTKHKNNTLEFLKSTIEVDRPATSCQLKFELEKGLIQMGNRIIANIGVQLLLNHLRGEDNSASYYARF